MPSAHHHTLPPRSTGRSSSRGWTRVRLRIRSSPPLPFRVLLPFGSVRRGYCILGTRYRTTAGCHCSCYHPACSLAFHTPFRPHSFLGHRSRRAYPRARTLSEGMRELALPRNLPLLQGRVHSVPSRLSLHTSLHCPLASLLGAVRSTLPCLRYRRAVRSIPGRTCVRALRSGIRSWDRACCCYQTFAHCQPACFHAPFHFAGAPRSTIASVRCRGADRSTRVHTRGGIACAVGAAPALGLVQHGPAGLVALDHHAVLGARHDSPARCATLHAVSRRAARLVFVRRSFLARSIFSASSTLVPPPCGPPPLFCGISISSASEGSETPRAIPRETTRETARRPCDVSAKPTRTRAYHRKTTKKPHSVDGTYRLP